MNIILLVISIIGTVLNNCLSGYAGKTLIRVKSDTYSFNAIQYFVSFLIFLCIALTQKVSWLAVVFGAGFGLVTVLGNVTKLFTLTMGPIYITNLVVASSMIVPTISGVFFNEELSMMKIFFIILLIFFIFITAFKKTEGEKFNMKWLVFLIITFIFIGSIGVLQKIFRALPCGDQTAPFLASAFFVSFTYSLIMSGRKILEKKKDFKFIIACAVCGVCVYIGNHVNLYLSGVLPSQIFFPLVNGIPLVLVSVISFTFFKEKFTKLQLAGLIGATISLVFICLV